MCKQVMVRWPGAPKPPNQLSRAAVAAFSHDLLGHVAQAPQHRRQGLPGSARHSRGAAQHVLIRALEEVQRQAPLPALLTCILTCLLRP